MEIAIFGFCRADFTRRVFVLSPTTEPGPDGPVPSITLDEIDFTTPEQVFLMGNHKAEILERIQLTRSKRPADSSFRQLAPRDVIREVIKEGRLPDIGGTVQLAQAHIDGFLQFMDLAGCGNTRSNHERLSSRRGSWSRFFHHPGIDWPIPVSGG